MIRRDYILQMIEEFARALARISLLRSEQRGDEAADALDEEFKRLVGEGPEAVARLSETELLARLMQGGPTQAVREKTLMLTTLLKEAGDLAVAQDRAEAGRECYLKALHLLLDALSRGEVCECPEFVPKVEMLKEALAGTHLPARTDARLMQHYERNGEFAKAEDALFGMLDADPDNDAIADFGIGFYQRVFAQNDATLNEGNLPRTEAEEGLTELERRRKHSRSAADKRP